RGRCPRRTIVGRLEAHSRPLLQAFRSARRKRLTNCAHLRGQQRHPTPRYAIAAASAADRGYRPAPPATSSSSARPATPIPAQLPGGTARLHPAEPALDQGHQLIEQHPPTGRSTLWLAATAASSGVDTTPHDHAVAVPFRLVTSKITK